MKKDKEKDGIKLVAISDIHGFFDGCYESISKEKFDILTISGDIEPCLIGVDVDAWFNDSFFKKISSLDCEVVAIPGNHDSWLASHYSTLDKYAPPNFHLLIDEENTFCGLRFYGTPWVPFMNGRWSFEVREEDEFDIYNQIPYGIDILLTHAPPLIKGKMIDVSLGRKSEWWGHCGSEELTRVVENKSPRLLLCGHIHTGDHSCHVIMGTENSKRTLAYNISILDENYDIAFSHSCFHVSNEEIRRL